MNFKTVTSKEQNAGIRMLKCYLASDHRGHFVTTSEAENMPGQVWGCVSCGCRLILHTGTHADSPWFEHDQATVAASTLMNCAHVDPAVKAEERSRILRSLVNMLNVPMMSLDWYCVWCGDHYSGEKICTTCGTGIYSIEEACWQINYT
ncbi:putative zinc ribbon protein [Phytobacter sp. SCO41]|uniref:putative zinc ribbon protein n=1 Tax=Phytobacter sp. SCO41 TaxID=1756993 RepID=UPI0015623F71|nr:putative zinc ribbon protein [Phytobacter sp. SCO41]